MLRTYWLDWKYSNQSDCCKLDFNKHGYYKRSRVSSEHIKTHHLG